MNVSSVSVNISFDFLLALLTSSMFKVTFFILSNRMSFESDMNILRIANISTDEKQHVAMPIHIVEAAQSDGISRVREAKPKAILPIMTYDCQESLCASFSFVVFSEVLLSM